MNIPGLIGALIMGGSTLLPWIYSYPRLDFHVHPGFTEITGQVLIPVSLAAIYLSIRQPGWAFRLGLIGLGLCLMGLFRIVTGENIAGAPMDIAYGLYVGLGGSVILLASTWKAFQNSRGWEELLE